MFLSPGTQVGRYRILATLGAGGMGEVYRARDGRLDRDVAVKVLPEALATDPDRLRRFEQEARAAGQLNHPHILAIYDVGTHEGAPFVVYELLDGKTLAEWLKGAPLPLRKVLDVAIQIARGLAAAHERGIVHRDLKPENLFLTRDGRLKILDFGLAKLTRPESQLGSGRGSPPGSSTETGTILGTAGYMAPEQVRGERSDQRSDLFAFGCILHEMISGQRAFPGGNAIESMYAILNLEPVSLAELRPEVAPALEEFVRHCLEKEPARRFQSSQDACFALQAIGGTVGVPAPRPPSVRATTRARVQLAVASIALLVGGGVLGALFHHPSARAHIPIFHRLTFRRGLVEAARFGPGGRTIVYGAAWHGGPAEIFSTEADHPESRSLGYLNCELLAVSSSGEMAIKLQNGTLARVPLAGGAPREILEQVGGADWAADGSELAVTTAAATTLTASSSSMGWRLEFPIGKTLYASQTWISEPRISPDGSRVAFVDHTVGGDTGGSIAVVGLDGRKRTLTPWREWIRGVCWAPGGHEVWFAAPHSGQQWTLQAVTLAGKERVVMQIPGGAILKDIAPDGRVLLARVDTRVEAHGASAGEHQDRDVSCLDQTYVSDVSNDGRRLLLVEQGEGVGLSYTTYLREANGSTPIRLFEGLGTALSPDGKWVLALTKDRQPPLTLQPTGPGSPVQLERGPIERYDWASWFPDGKRIICSGREHGGESRCYVQDMSGGPPRSITPPGTNLYNPGAAVSPDGNYFIARNMDETATLYPLGGGAPQPVSGIMSGDYAIRWTGDGRGLFVATSPGGHVYRLDPSTGRRELWRVPAPSDSAGFRGISTVQITPDGRSCFYALTREVSDLYLLEGLR